MNTARSVNEPAGRPCWRPLLVPSILIAGVLCTWWLAGRADREMREDLLRQARLVAGAVNPDRVRALTGTEADLESPVYLRLKDQFGAIRAANPQCRFVYLVGRKADGTVFFFVDSEPVGSADESPAGQVYGEAPEAHHRVFHTRAAAVEGPVSDRWGTWVSARVPLTDPQTAELLAVLSMDIDARVWNRNVAARSAIPAGLILVLIVIVLVGSSLLARRAGAEGLPPRRPGHLELVLTVVVGLVLTLFTAWLVQDESVRNQARSFHHLAESRTAALAEILCDLRDVEIEGLARFYEGSEHVTREEFRNYTEFLARNRAVQAWEWIRAVPASERERFEQATRAEGIDDFEIWQNDAGGGRIPAAGRETYYPVVRVMPEEGRRKLLGFDLGSEPVRRAAIEEALRTGLIAGTDPVTLVQETGSQKGILVFRPVFADAQRKAPRGLPVAVLGLGDALAASGPDAVVAEELLLARNDRPLESLVSSWTAKNPPTGNLTARRPVFAYGKTFIVAAHAGPEFLRMHPARAGVPAALVGLVITATVAVVLSLVLRRRQALEMLVRERTSALRASEVQLSATLRSIGDGVIACDRDGRVTSLNRAAELLTGWTTAEAAGRPLEEVFCVVHAQTRETAENPVSRALREGVIADLAIHSTLVARDGREYQIADSCAPIRDASEAVIGAVLVFRDVTGEYQRREELRHIKTAVDAAGDAIGIATADARHFYQNEAFTRLFGYSLEELAHERPDVLYANPEDADTVFQTIMSGGSFLDEVEMVAKDGRRLLMLLRADCVKDDDGRISGLIGVHTDITERRRAEEEREKLQAQLIQAQKIESVGRLAGGVAHDFNNMLGVILGHTEMALDRIGPDKALHASLEEIQRAAQRSANLTRQLLAFARKQTVAPRVLDLNETVTGVLKMLRPLIGEDIEVIWKPGSDLWPVRIDAAQFDQILANLCVNARDAIEGVGTITIETANASVDEEYSAQHAGITSGDYVRLVVSDNGCGMDAETLSHMFEPFFTTKEVGKGTGLGLATVYGAVKQNRGFVSVYSEPGRGTTFQIHLPRYVAGAAIPADQPLAGVAAARGSETILLVEDEPAILKMTTMMLKKLGYAVLTASTPGEAIRLARDHPGRIDVLMTDVVMPEMNGRELAKNLLSIHPDMARLFMSGYTADVIAHRGVLDEGVHFIQKPFSKTELAAKLRDAMGKG